MIETADVAGQLTTCTACSTLGPGRRAVDVIRQNYGMSIAVNAARLADRRQAVRSPVLAAICATRRRWRGGQQFPVPLPPGPLAAARP